MNIPIHQPSFLIGFIAGVLLIWFWRLLGPTIKDLRRSLRGSVSTVQTSMSGSLDLRYRQDVIRWIQNNHLAAHLFSLDEITIEPRFMPPVPRVIPGEELPPDDSYSLTIPHLPDWPELAAAFNAPTLSFEEVVQGSNNVAITGKPGIGKSFALNVLASKLAHRDPNLGKLSNRIPVIVHLGDINLNHRRRSPANILYEAIKDNFSSTVEAQLENFLAKILEGNSAILLIDGFDELPPHLFDPYIEFLAELSASHPDLQIVITASTDCMPYADGLVFSPIALAAFNHLQKSEFIRKWGALWKKHITNQSWAKALPAPPEDVHIDGWLSSDRKTGNPAYLTLTVWAVFNGDTLGASPSDAFEAYIRRFTSDISNARQALEQLAVQMSLSGVPFIERKQAGKFVSQYEDSSAITDLDSNTENPSSMLGDDTEDELDLVAEDMRELDDLEIPAAPSENAKLDRPVSARKVRRMLPEMVKNRILKYRGDSTISFSHSIIGGYLAGCGLSSLGGEQELIRQSDWPGKKIPFLFLSGKKDVSYLIDQFITDTRDDTLRNRLVTIGTWPSISKGKSPWRGKVMRKLATSINESNLPIGVRAQAVAALALSGEAGVARLFRQLMTSPREDLQMLAAIGAGLVQDSKALEQLNELQYCPYPSVRRSACLALVAIGSGESIEMAAAALLHGEDDVRRTAAEALAVHPLDGHAMLKEGAELDDLAVRRAITYGLGRIDEEWARELLERMQLEDEQWIVRTTAGQVLETQDKQSSILYSSLGELSETPWLVTFASEQGMGLSPGEASWNMLVRALRDGNQDQKLAAMDVYRQNPNEAGKVIPIIVDLMGGRDGEIREAAYQTLWQVSRYGVEVH